MERYHVPPHVVEDTGYIVYLAGPITGQSYAESTDWREYARVLLKDRGIRGVSPMRGKDYLSQFSQISGTGKEYAHLGVFATPKGVLTRDHWDATRCDLMLVNLLGAKQVSIGTVMEIAWAYTHRIPIVCAMEAEGNIHEHMMLTGAVSFQVPTLEEAIRITEAVLV